MSSQLGARVYEVKESAEALAKAAAEKLGDVRAGTADALHTAASSVRTTGRQGAKVIDGLTTGAANRLDAVGSFVKKYRLKNIPVSVRRTVRQYPAGSLIAATAVGFLAASCIWHSRD